MWVVEGVETSDWRRTGVSVPRPTPCAYSVICGRLHIFGCVSGERGARARVCVCARAFWVLIQFSISIQEMPVPSWSQGAGTEEKGEIAGCPRHSQQEARAWQGRPGCTECPGKQRWSRRKLPSEVGGGDRGLHSPGLPPGLSPHLRRPLPPGPARPFCLGFEAEPQRRLWPRRFLCGAPPPASAPLSRLLSCSPSRSSWGLGLSFFNQVICLFSV